MKPAEPVPCDVLIIEATFGSPRFQFPSIDEVSDNMVKWAEEKIKEGKIPTFQTDSLGNSQEIISIFNKSTEFPVVTSPSISKINEIYRSHGFRLEYIDSGFAVVLVSGWALHRNNGFPLSDHADFKDALKFVGECNPKLVLTCHGGKNNYILAEHVEKRLKIQSYPIQLIPTKIECKIEEERISSCKKQY